MSLLSVVIPAYNEEQMISVAVDTLTVLLDANHISHELIFVDDGSKDSTWEHIQNCSRENPCVRGVHFSRNFGKEAAIMAGLNHAIGDCCVVIDCDLQHPPEKIIEMYGLWQQGYEIVEGVKSDRGRESVLHRAACDMFYTLISAAAGFDMSGASDFKLLDRKAVDVMISLPEKHAFFRALSGWIGFKTVSVPFQVQERTAGESKWSTLALVKYAFNNISSFSSAPMQVVIFLGMAMFLVSMVLGGIALAQKLSGQAVEGFTTIILIQLFSSSVIMISLGIIGGYIAKIYEETKNRPRYIVAATCGKEKDR